MWIVWSTVYWVAIAVIQVAKIMCQKTDEGQGLKVLLCTDLDQNVL